MPRINRDSLGARLSLELTAGAVFFLLITSLKR